MPGSIKIKNIIRPVLVQLLLVYVAFAIMVVIVCLSVSEKTVVFPLSMIGLVMATVLNIVLIRISAAKNRADAESRQKSSFLAMMSHEIRTPINAILGIAETQIQNRTLPPDTSEALNKIYHSGYSLLGIINDVLDFSEIEAGKLAITPAQYDVASLIHDITQLNMTRIGSKPLKFNLQADPFTPAELIGDELRIKQILNNMLSNAFKYTDSGEVALSVTSKREDGGKEPRILLIFHISDTGQGMSADQVNSTGLGMSITKHLVELMHGTISVNSEPGKGTAFTIHLPQGIVDTNVLGTQVAENLRLFRLNNNSQKCADSNPGDILETDDCQITDEDKSFLEESLILFRAACTVYDKKAAKDILNELKEKNWPRPVREMLNSLTEQLLHSEFEAASDIARDFEV